MLSDALIQTASLIFFGLFIYGVTRAFQFQTTPIPIANPKKSSLLSLFGAFIGFVIIGSIFLIGR
ncbi:MAG: hypothetical protein ACHQQQ_15160 [Bacteroidota bacterium]